ANKSFHLKGCLMRSYPVLAPVSRSYPRARGRLPTCYSPVRRSCTPKGLTARLACVKHAASVRPEPGSNSPTMSEKSIEATRNNSGTLKETHKGVNKALLAFIDTLLSSQTTHA